MGLLSPSVLPINIAWQAGLPVIPALLSELHLIPCSMQLPFLFCSPCPSLSTPLLNSPLPVSASFLWLRDVPWLFSAAANHPRGVQQWPLTSVKVSRCLLWQSQILIQGLLLAVTSPQTSSMAAVSLQHPLHPCPARDGHSQLANLPSFPPREPAGAEAPPAVSHRQTDKAEREGSHTAAQRAQDVYLPPLEYQLNSSAEDTGQQVAGRCPHHEASGTAKQGQTDLSLLNMSISSKAKSSTDRHEGVGNPGRAGGCCEYFETQRAEGFVLHEQQGTDWPTAQFLWLLFPAEEFSSPGNQTVALCKTGHGCLLLLRSHVVMLLPRV